MGQHLTTWKERNGKTAKWISIWSIFFAVLSMAIYFYFDLKKVTDEIELENRDHLVVITTPTPTPTEEVVTKKGWMVDIKGEVNKPGTYAVDDSMRIVDVIYLAGELTEKADTSLLNLSKKVEDQMVIIIYNKEEVAYMKETLKKEKELNVLCKNEELIKNDACVEVEVEEEKSSIVNINTASKEELMTLNGVGESKALAILTYRSTKKFDTIEELLNVPGIGENIFETIKDKISVE